MPSEYQLGLYVYPCESHPDGSVGYCSKIIHMKVHAAQAESAPFAWKDADEDALCIPIAELVAMLEELGATVTLDEQRLESFVDNVGEELVGPDAGA